MSTKLLLIDLSSIAHQMFHVSGNDPDPNATANKTVERIRALASGQPHVAVCMDSPPYFRKDISPDYKANRDKENNAVIAYQINAAADTLRGDGFPVWAVNGYEADDLIATAVRAVSDKNGEAFAKSGPGAPVEYLPDVQIASADKDLLQLINERVTIKSLRDGSTVDAEAVKTKFGVKPHQMVDYLSLVGDTSDNILGAKGIGPLKAAALLNGYGNLEDIYSELTTHGTNFTPSLATSLREFEPRMATVRSLITLRTDAPIPFEEIFRERVPADVAVFGTEETMPDETENAVTDSPVAQSPEVVGDSERTEIRRDAPDAADSGAQSLGPALSTFPASNAQEEALAKSRAIAVRVPSAPIEWERQLEPRTYGEAKQLSADLFASRLFSGYGSPAAVLSTVIIGRELSLPVGASLRGFHIIDGKHAMSADLIRARVLASPLCEYFRITERSATKATWVTKRRGDPEVKLTYTIEEGRQAWQKDQKAWDLSAWGKRSANMVTKTGSTTLARLIYPDVVGGFYCPEELTGEEV